MTKRAKVTPLRMLPALWLSSARELERTLGVVRAESVNLRVCRRQLLRALRDLPLTRSTAVERLVTAREAGR